MANTFTFAWIGLGAMGGPMAAHLVSAGNKVKGFDLGEEAKKKATESGVEMFDTVAEAVQGVDAVFMTLPAGPHVRSTLSEDNGVWDSIDEGTLIVDCSSVDLETSRWCHTESKQRGFGFVDAPISGSVTGAHDATLTFMLGGEPDNITRVREYIQPMGKTFVDLGGPTTGMAAKLCNNMMLFNNVSAAAESAKLAEKLGIDSKAFWELVNVSTGHSWAQEHWYPVAGVAEDAPSDHDFQPTGFAALGAHKDLTNALAAGEEVGAQLPTTKLSQEKLQKLIDEGHGKMDNTFVASLVFPEEN
ncbi:NAD(P)-dependent oxidoreductase [Corynebacterium sp. S7]